MTQRNPGGRPTKFTPERIQRLQNTLRTGVPIETACAVAGINPQTYYGWKSDAKAARASRDAGEAITPHQTALIEFLEATEVVMAEVEATLAGSLMRSAMGYQVEKTTEVVSRETRPDGTVVDTIVERKTVRHQEFDPNSAKFILERRFPQNWRQQLQVVQPRDLSNMTAAELEAYEAQLLAMVERGTPGSLN